MHSIHSDSTIFPYQVLERRPAQETITGRAGLHAIEFEVTLCMKQIKERFTLHTCFMLADPMII
jgi:hypothetical protein